jgi:hypothetical protein
MKASEVETIRLDEFLPNDLWALVHTDKGLAGTDRPVDVRAARAYGSEAWSWRYRLRRERSVTLSAWLRGVT